jgi:F-type H+-transporting ATPase subunit a
MESPIWIAVVVNRLIGKPVAALLALLHIQVASKEFPVSNSVSMEILVVLLAMVFFLWLKGRISVDRPGATQQVMEMLLSNPMGVGVRDLIRDNIHHGGDEFLPLIGSMGIFILFCNLINLIPTLEAPTATVSVPLGCAAIVFVYYNFIGIVKMGFGGHGKHFLGPTIWLSPLMLPIEVLSHLFRMLSLTVRLWVNMLVSEMLYVIFLGMMLSIYLYLGKLGRLGQGAAVFPLLIPMVLILLHIFVAILQAFVFTILPVIYVAGAVEEH